MYDTNSTTIGNHPTKIGYSPISEMSGALAQLDAEIAADPAAYAGPLGTYEPDIRYNDILRTIEETPAQTIADLKAKAQALATELKKDYAWDCDGDTTATARSLAESIMRDILALK